MDDAAKEGYSAALQLNTKTAKTIWDVFRSLLAANAFLVAISGAIIKFYPDLLGLTKVLGALGILICIAWVLITMRNFDYYKYYFAWARELEKAAFGSKVEMVRLGEQFARGETVKLADHSLRLRWGSRLFRIEWLIYVIIMGFTVIYIFVLFSSNLTK